MCTEFGTFLVRAGILSAEQIVDVLEFKSRRQAPIAALAVRSNLLTTRQIGEIWTRQQACGLSFVDLAKQLGYLSDSQCQRLIEQQQQSGPTLRQAVVELELLSAGQVIALWRVFQQTPAAEVHTALPKPKFAASRSVAAQPVAVKS